MLVDSQGKRDFDTLLTALAQVDFDFRLEIVGEGELEDNLKRQAEKLWVDRKSSISRLRSGHLGLLTKQTYS